jgi:hypothetical protein
MNKKLLMSSALVGSLALAGSAVAETKITGSAVFTYSAVTGQTALDSDQGFGSEVQIDISTSGDLNVGGLKYKAGFSLEQDGGDAADAISAQEGQFFSLVSGSTEVMFNLDKAPNLSQSATPRVISHLNDTIAAMPTAIYDFSPGAQGQQLSFNTALIQKTDVGTVSFVYVPKLGDSGGNNDNMKASSQFGGSQMDLIYSGNLGVKGLTAVAGYSKLEGQTAGTGDTTTKQLGVGYNFGKFAVGVTRNDTKNVSNGTSAATANDVTSDEFGVTFAASDKLSFGIQYAETETSLTNTIDEEITTIGMGYNLGGAALQIYAAKMENAAGSRSAKDAEKAAIRLSTKF